MTLKDLIQSDIDSVFLSNAEEFSGRMKVGFSSSQYKYLYGSLQSSTVQNNAGGSSPLIQYTHTLYIAVKDIARAKLKAGAALYIDDICYKVVDYMEEMGVFTINLKRG